MDRSSTYGGFDRVLAQMEGRRDPLTFAPGEALPDLHIDLAPLRQRRVGEGPDTHQKSASTYSYKYLELKEEFLGQPELLWLHGLLVAALRRRAQPAQAAPLFLRIWREEAPFLLTHLGPRWLVSAATTFADHGTTEAQRRVGHSLAVLFATMKLYETERLHVPASPKQPFDGPRKSGPLALDMDAYAIVNGGLDVNMLGRLWQDAGGDDTIRPLARHLLGLLDTDDRTVFRRLRLMREARENRQEKVGELFSFAPLHDKSNVAPAPAQLASLTAGPLRWGVVSTVQAPLPQIARFAAYHLSEGAARIQLYLDTPDAETAAFFSGDSRVRVIQCTQAYWDRHRAGRPETHQGRQMRNATHAYRRSDLDWLAHLDVDEVLMPPIPMSDLLVQVPADTAVVHVRPAEMLAGGTQDSAAFKLTPRFAGTDKAALQQIYPTFGAHLRGGYISHLEGKAVVRVGIPECRLGIHALLYRGEPAANRAELRNGWVGHAHVRDWQDFRDRLDFRMKKGSYQRRGTTFGLYDVLEFLKENEGEDGLRQFYDEVCADTPALRQALDDHQMLLTRHLDLDERCRQVFGRVPPVTGT
ncbi:glycosyltransferase family 2 protein [Pseudooceanicola sediminis]|uniref:Glycosyltransferase family 2 protein n=1 Tax=Pseudooceanicola sediminis TaxID=2211117 RepID=A0A399J1H8_9RHOB|nr:glycosyltransferase family 2 protein [Pseudooceanicola sediminis]KAA2316156.1 glycosyltransferase family 2 protein [Puniceibacterium sp. HSS470]RII39071.1 glycosyltransferase family 2 protein [Pseudooceanicola sediminis]|tara:strand:- start:113944 stop:115698 length:1755 start_codon:yes stop_codon:yes gene_type:complete